MDLTNATSSATTLDLSTVDALLDAMMTDLPDLPPMGVPPSGHYNLKVTWGIETVGDENREVIVAKYLITDINELNNEDERADVAVGQRFTEFFYTVKRDKTPNVFSIGKMKQRLVPLVAASGESQIRALIAWAKEINIAATIKRTVNKKNEDQFNVDVRDIIVL